MVERFFKIIEINVRAVAKANILDCYKPYFIEKTHSTRTHLRFNKNMSKTVASNLNAMSMADKTIFFHFGAFLIVQHWSNFFGLVKNIFGVIFYDAFYMAPAIVAELPSSFTGVVSFVSPNIFHLTWIKHHVSFYMKIL